MKEHRSDSAIGTSAGDKYSVLLVEDPDAEEEDARGGPRVAFQIMPRAAVEPAPAPGWQNAAAAVLFLFTIGSCLQLGLAANVSQLPKVRSHSAPLPSLSMVALCGE